VQSISLTLISLQRSIFLSLCQKKLAVTAEFAVIVIVQVNPLGLQPDHDTLVEGAVGVADRVIGVPLTNAALHEPGQVIPDGELVTVPLPLVMLTVKRGELPVPPLPVKQTTFACMLPVTMAPFEVRFPELLFVCTVAETSVPPHAPPVAVINPVELTVTICGSLEPHTTSFVMSLVTGG
jgi:hypothetical protein